LQVTGLPAGLSATVESTSGTVNGITVQNGTIKIGGTPTQSGTFTLQITLADGNGDLGGGTYTLTIDVAALTLGSLSPTQWSQNEPDYNGTIAISGGTGTYSNLQVTGLPMGLSAALSGSTITISGTPTQSGTFDLGVSVQDSDNTQASGNIWITGTPTESGKFALAVYEQDSDQDQTSDRYQLVIDSSTPHAG